ncbi:Lipoate synthase [uncultured Candidatus Thioglobus sp.]|nr:Lipoate synthase [uncultured Candidatus Thioglobus sp.]
MNKTQNSPTIEQRGKLKTAKLPVKVTPRVGRAAPKPAWIRSKLPIGGEVLKLKSLLRTHKLHTVCEEASCPNLSECFSHGTATFMILGDICTRRCPFCSVAHGRPRPVDAEEPEHLAQAIEAMQLKYVVITSVDRDDLKDGGSGHFSNCIQKIREKSPQVTIEILVPDFRRRIDIALEKLAKCPPDVLNHNLETVPSLYRKARPGADYAWSLNLLKKFKAQHPNIPTKSGLMLGLGESIAEVQQVLHDLRAHDCDMLTLGQYLQPSRYHLSVERFVAPEEFVELKHYAQDLGFSNIASAPMVRSSYHADLQAIGGDF